MSDQSSDPTLAQLLCFNVYALNRALNRHHLSAYGDTGMSYPKFVVLAALDEAGPLTVSQLAEFTCMEPSTLSPLLKRMAEYGVLTRSRSAQDERKVLIELTEMGKTSVTLVRNAVLGSLAAMDLGPAQTAQLVDALGAVRRRVETAEPAPKVVADGLPPPLPDC